MQILKHDQYLDELIAKLNTNNSQIIRNHQLFSTRKRIIAEIDLLQVDKHRIRVYEVKCSYRLKKAKRQLEKIKKLLENTHDKQIQTFFYHGNAKQLIEL
ncbi:MAG: hypothetical protein ACMXYF_00120 [Candidatus Woesearchaeota archaeon]